MTDYRGYRLEHIENAYMYLAGACITERHDETGTHWIISTPQEHVVCDTEDKLRDCIEVNLSIMEELVDEGQIERELWDEAWSFANGKEAEYAEACMEEIASDMYGYHDPLDKPATEITVWDVYKVSELL